jgi:hypothetical protein
MNNAHSNAPIPYTVITRYTIIIKPMYETNIERSSPIFPDHLTRMSTILRGKDDGKQDLIDFIFKGANTISIHTQY